MDSEELEQIPWASLVAEQTDGLDKRVYMAGAVVAAFVLLILGMRLLAGGGQPVPVAAAPAPEAFMVTPDQTPAPSPAQPSETPMVVAEADLRAEPVAEPPTTASDLRVRVAAEWFVTDWFTRDGSSETMRSIRAALSPSLASTALPHEDSDGQVVFVEWAKTVETSRIDDTTVQVIVAYRTIRKTEDGYVRNPVAMAVVTVDDSLSPALVTALPTES